MDILTIINNKEMPKDDLEFINTMKNIKIYIFSICKKHEKARSTPNSSQQPIKNILEYASNLLPLYKAVLIKELFKDECILIQIVGSNSWLDFSKKFSQEFKNSDWPLYDNFVEKYNL